MKRRATLLLSALALVLALLFAACGAEAKGSGGDYYPEEAPAMAADGLYEEYEYENAEAPEAQGETALDGQKLIRRVHLTAETEDYNTTMAAVQTKIRQLGGYLESAEEHTSGNRPNASLVIRVPAGQLDDLTEFLAGSANITYRSESQENVTLQYVDTESRIQALNTEQERLLQLLEQAESLEDILEIEDRLAEVRYRLESAQSSLRVLANQVDYATVYLDLRQVEVLTPVEEPGFWQGVGEGFIASCLSLWEICKDLFKGLVVAMPFLLVLVIIPLVILLVVLKNARRRRKAKAAAAPKPPVPPANPANPVPPVNPAPPAAPGPERL